MDAFIERIIKIADENKKKLLASKEKISNRKLEFIQYFSAY